MDIDVGAAGDCQVVVLRGALSAADVAEVRSVVATVLAAWPPCVIFDLSALRYVDRDGLATLVANPEIDLGVTTVLIAGATGQPAEAIRALGLHRFVAVDATVAHARVRAARHRRQRVVLAAEPDPAQVPLLRRRCRETLVAWELAPRTVHDAVLVAGELAGNAAAHAGTPYELRLYRLDLHRVTVAVRDGSDRMPVWSGVESPPGHTGLHLVRRLSSAAGAYPVPTVGKIVWSVLDDRSRPEDDVHATSRDAGAPRRGG